MSKKKNGAVGHPRGVTQVLAAPAPQSDDAASTTLTPSDAMPHQPTSDGADGRTHTVTQQRRAICALLTELHRNDQDLIRAQTSLTNTIKAKCRRLCKGDKDAAGKIYKEMSCDQLTPDAQAHGVATAENDESGAETKVSPSILVPPLVILAAKACEPFTKARAEIESERTKIEKEMVRVFRGLPISAWVDSVKGLGELSAARIIGETGPLTNYANPAKVWKRMGLSVENGERFRRVKGVENGYCPRRRSISWVVADTFFRAQGKDDTATEWRQLYDQRRAHETERNPKITDGAAHARAKRYVEKRLLREMWRAWWAVETTAT